MPGITIEVHGGEHATLVAVCGEVDLASSPALRACLLAQHGAVVVDLSRVTFLDSSGLNTFVAAQKHLAGKLSLRSPQPHVRRTLEATALDGWIEGTSD